MQATRPDLHGMTDTATASMAGGAFEYTMEGVADRAREIVNAYVLAMAEDRLRLGRRGLMVRLGWRWRRDRGDGEAVRLLEREILTALAHDLNAMLDEVERRLVEDGEAVEAVEAEVGEVGEVGVEAASKSKAKVSKQAKAKA